MPPLEPVVLTVARDGVRLRVLDWGGTGPDLVLLHPNGFCAGLFDPLARRLAGSRRVLGVDLRGHGGSDAPGDRGAYRYEELARDVVAALDALAVAQATILGESLGGGVAILVDLVAPGRVSGLILCEAIAFPGRELRERHERNPLADLARRRRRVWPDRAAIVASYARKPPLFTFAPEALEAYVAWGTRDRPDGRVELACDPEVEATLFEVSGEPGGAPLAWDHLGTLGAPAVVAAGTGSDLPQPWFEGQARRAGTELVHVDGGHFFLQEDTTRAVQLVSGWLERLGA